MIRYRTALVSIGFMFVGAVCFGLLALLMLPLPPGTIKPGQPQAKVEVEQIKEESNLSKVNMKVKFVKAKPEQAEAQKTVKKITQATQTRKQNKYQSAEKKATTPLSYKYKKQLADRGKAALGNKGQMIDSFPDIRITTDKHLSSREYIRAMQGLGGEFGIMDRYTDRLVSLIDFRGEQITPVNNLSGVSPKARFIKEEHWVEKYIIQARREHGPGKYQVILLIPMNLDHYIAGAIEDALGRSKIATKDVESLSGWYRKSGTSLAMELRELRMKNGKRQKVNINLKLGA